MKPWRWLLGALLAAAAAGWLLVNPAQVRREHLRAELLATNQALRVQRHQLLIQRAEVLAALSALINAPAPTRLPFMPLELNRIAGVKVTGWQPLDAGGEIQVTVGWPQALEVLRWMARRAVVLKSVVVRRENARLLMQMRLDNDPSS